MIQAVVIDENYSYGIVTRMATAANHVHCKYMQNILCMSHSTPKCTI